MTLAQVQAAVAVVAILIGTWAGLLIGIALLLPKHAAKAEMALELTPWRSFLIGLGMLLPIVISVVLIGSPVGALKVVGFLALLGLTGAISLGASGLALLMGRRIGEMSGAKTSFGALVRGSLVFSMAMGFPYIGWFLFLPVSLVISLGAGVTALFTYRQNAFPPVTPNRSDYDILGGQGVA